ncbi:MAG TPA: RNA methyltransferase [Solirubrobacteraceae bacterium]|jgi:TrmH family RNA methyltransferase|nr:RNA methyltransferase [Solirubrobacteraceae bacterium]
MTITSHHNQRLKEIRKLRQRRRERERSARFVAEGEDLLAAADAAGWPALERFCVAGSGLAGIEIEPAALASVSGLASGTRTLAVYEERWAPAALGPLCVYLHGVSDPGNVGAVLRSAQAFGASSVVLGPGTADPYSPKAVRASMGAIFAVPVARAAADAQVAELPGSTIALVAGSGVPLADVVDVDYRIGSQRQPPPATTLLIGAEREGLPDALVDQADRVARIPIATDSLNAAMAATVALYELTRMPPA